MDIITFLSDDIKELVLKASTQAAAGEAGRDFSVAVDELQRIAEHYSHSRTGIIALVENIQLETNEIIVIMNTLIGQIAGEWKLAKDMGEQMMDTQDISSKLGEMVAQIVKVSKQQAQISNDFLRERAGTIKKSTQETGRQLEEMMIQTDSLMEIYQQLITSIRRFKLPDTQD